MAQGVEQAARALELGVVADPDLGQRLVRRQLAGDAAGVHPLHRGVDARVAEQVGPQGGEGQVRSAGQSFHRGSGTIAHLPRSFFRERHDDKHHREPHHPRRQGRRPRGDEARRAAGRRAGSGEVRIRHHAIGLNFIDVYQRSGVYTLPLPLSLGNEGAGVIEAVGEAGHAPEGGRPRGLLRRAAGRLLRWRGSCRRGTSCRLPDAISFETGAAMMLKGLTTQYLFKRTRPQEDLVAGRLHRLPCRRRRRRPDRLPVGPGARPEADRHGRQRREVRPGARQRRRLHHQLPHRGLRRAGQGDHRRQGREGGLRLDRQGHLGEVARLPAAVRPDGQLRQRLGRAVPPFAPWTLAQKGSLLRHPADAVHPHRRRASRRRRWPTTCSRWSRAGR